MIRIFSNKMFARIASSHFLLWKSLSKFNSLFLSLFAEKTKKKSDRDKSDQKMIGIVGGSFVNKGAEAMTRVVADYFYNKHGYQSLMLVYSKSKKDVKIEYIIERKDRLKKMGTVLDLISGVIYFIFRDDRLLTKRLRLINKVDFIIDVHGFVYYNSNGFKAILSALLYILISKLLRKKYFVMQQSFEYLSNWKKRFAFKLLIPLADKIYVRGEASRERFNKMVKKPVEIKPDLAFLFKQEYLDDENVLNNQIFQSGKRVIGILPSSKFLKNSQISVEDFSSLINTLLETGKYAVVLMPHELKEQGDGDAEICEKIYNQISDRKKHDVLLIVKNYSAGQFKYLVGKCDIVITSRFHGAVGALSQGIPTITLSWAFKYKELLDWFEMGEYCFDKVDIEKILIAIRRIEDNYTNIQDKINKRVIKIKESLSQQLADIYNESQKK